MTTIQKAAQRSPLPLASSDAWESVNTISSNRFAAGLRQTSLRNPFMRLTGLGTQFFRGTVVTGYLVEIVRAPQIVQKI